jgi:hypothetical protein
LAVNVPQLPIKCFGFLREKRITVLYDYRKTDKSDFNFTHVNLLFSGAYYKITPVLGNGVLRLGGDRDSQSSSFNTFKSCIVRQTVDIELHLIVIRQSCHGPLS